jgi:hypothetical protein
LETFVVLFPSRTYRLNKKIECVVHIYILAIGVVPDNYPDNLLPGEGRCTVGYHSDGKYVSTTLLSKYL